MDYSSPLLECRLLRRYKRFLADVELDSEVHTVHCANTGSMAGLLEEGNLARVSGPHGGKRKLPYSLEQIRIHRPDKRELWVGVNTGLPNRLVEEIAAGGGLPGFEDCTRIEREVKLGEHSRIDLKLSFGKDPCAWVEVKNCTMVQADVADKGSINSGSTATFPDAVTARGLKHLNVLMERVHAGERAAVVFTIQRNDADCFAPAHAYDPVYAERFYEAQEAGVVMIPIVADVGARGIALRRQPLPVVRD